MRDGRIEQVGSPRAIYERPQSRYVAEFLGSANLIDGVVERRGPGGSYAIATTQGSLRATSAREFPTGAAVLVAIRSEDLHMEPASEDGRPNHWIGSVQARAFRGDAVDHLVGVGGLELRVRSPASVTIEPGTSVGLTLDEHACILLPPG